MPRRQTGKMAGWMMGDGSPHKVLVGRILQKLKKDKLVEDGRNGPELTEKGRQAYGTFVTTAVTVAASDFHNRNTLRCALLRCYDSTITVCN